MRATTHVAVLMAHFYFAAAQGPNCAQNCLVIDPYNPTNPCGPNVPPPDPGPLCECFNWLSENNGGEWVKYQGRKSLEIWTDYVVHNWCRKNQCWRWDYCSLKIMYDYGPKGRHELTFEMPGYDDCCTLPNEGKIVHAEMRKQGW